MKVKAPEKVRVTITDANVPKAVRRIPILGGFTPTGEILIYPWIAERLDADKHSFKVVFHDRKEPEPAQAAIAAPVPQLPAPEPAPEAAPEPAPEPEEPAAPEPPAPEPVPEPPPEEEAAPAEAASEEPEAGAEGQPEPFTNEELDAIQARVDALTTIQAGQDMIAELGITFEEGEEPPTKLKDIKAALTKVVDESRPAA